MVNPRVEALFTSWLGTYEWPAAISVQELYSRFREHVAVELGLSRSSQATPICGKQTFELLLNQHGFEVTRKSNARMVTCAKA